MAWARSDKRIHARVLMLLIHALDDTPTESLVWMPAHTSLADVGRAVLSNGSLLTVIDRTMNDRADCLAKRAVEAHRVPRLIRQQIKAEDERTTNLARWIGQVT